MIVGFNAMNHPQQIAKRGARPEVDDRATAPEVFAQLDERFRFTIDVAALPHNRKCKRYFAPPGFTVCGCMWRPECPPDCRCPHEEQSPVGVDGLARTWACERVWCNPPYSSIEPWIEKAHAEWSIGLCDLIVMLLPANRTEQGWWQRQVEPYRDGHGPIRVEFLPGRLRFIAHDRTEIKPNERPPLRVLLTYLG